MGSFHFSNGKISEWKSTGIFNYSNDSGMRGNEDPKTRLPELKKCWKNACFFIWELFGTK